MFFSELLGTLAHSSAQSVSTLSKDNGVAKELKEHLYIKTDIEKDFKYILDNSLKKGNILFLCGSSGDGKSELLSRYYEEYSENFIFHLDATHSFKPDQTAVEALDRLFDEHQDWDKPLIIGINVGMLFNYQNSGAEKHSSVKEAINQFTQGKNPYSKYQFLNFEDYPKFSLEDGNVGSKFISLLLHKVTEAVSENPLHRAYKADPSKEIDLKWLFVAGCGIRPLSWARI
ncbi:DNA phosphorothioation-dependent restriction protein DptF [Larsenimonas salina]|uniref:DNA phosphorothioation-dependent restriction protein DptF n=1 Tax=Larsenimonas salina TaxID=1295565 RepID=UPI002073622A|nr:DNA phosphorothioation-dependent restriction protein DptF [Larsenimonas salina]MCM5705052.1 DNA phosphorothioation-dependent restriction protein DptF [Larsenimonas salina]